MNRWADKRYRVWQEAVLGRDRYICQDCKEVGGYLQAHHIVSWTEDINKRYDLDNGVTLCLLCHGRRHGHPDGFVGFPEAGGGRASRNVAAAMLKDEDAIAALLEVVHNERAAAKKDFLKLVEAAHLKRTAADSDKQGAAEETTIAWKDLKFL